MSWAESRLLQLIIVGGGLWLSAPAAAELPPHPRLEERPQPFSELWTGAFYGFALSGGVAGDAGQSGHCEGADLELSAVTNLIGLAVRYRSTPALGQRRHSLAAEWVVYPLFLLNLGGDRWWTALASTHLSFGPLLWLADEGISRGATLGLGGDMPFTELDEGWSLWLGAELRLLLLDEAALGADWHPSYAALVRVSLRIHGLP